MPETEYPLITIIRAIRDKWRVLTSGCIGTPLEGGPFHRLAADRGNEAEKLLWQLQKEQDKLIDKGVK